MKKMLENQKGISLVEISIIAISVIIIIALSIFLTNNFVNKYKEEQAKTLQNVGLAKELNATYELASNKADNSETIQYKEFSAEIKNVTSSGYDVYVHGVDSSSVKNVFVTTWSKNYGQANANKLKIATKQNGGNYYYRVNIADFDGENGEYCSEIYTHNIDDSVTKKETINANVPQVVIKFYNNYLKGNILQDTSSINKYYSSGATINNSERINDPTASEDGYVQFEMNSRRCSEEYSLT